MDESETVDAYQTALEFLLAGAMPVIVDAEDGMHVLKVLPTSRDTLTSMIHPDPAERLRFMVSIVRAVKNRVEGAAQA